MEEFYKLLLAERENDSKRYWTIFNLMNIINAGLLAVIITRGTPNNHFQDLAAWFRIIPWFGMILCGVWFFAEVRMIGWIQLWEAKLKKVEEYYSKDAKPISDSNNFASCVGEFKVFRNRDEEKPFWWAFLPTRYIGPALSILFFAIWVVILVIF